MLNTSLLLAFIPTFLFVSFTPGMCMTLSMTLGISIGVRRTAWMMLGELIAVAIVAVSAVVGVAAIILSAPWAFILFKCIGGLYLCWLGFQMWRSKGKMAITENINTDAQNIRRRVLFSQGFVTAIANPKGWAFFMVLLPPFIDRELELGFQLMVLVAIILLIEGCALLTYAMGGQALKRLLSRSNNVRLLNRVTGTLMVAVGFWLALS